MMHMDIHRDVTRYFELSIDPIPNTNLQENFKENETVNNSGLFYIC